MEQPTTTTTTVSWTKLILFLIVTFCVTICLIITIYLFVFKKSSSLESTDNLIATPQTTTTTTTTLSPEEVERLIEFKKFLNLPSTHPNPNPSNVMNQFMRSIYRKYFDEHGVRRRKRYLQNHRHHLTDETDYIISLPNQSSNKNQLYFEYTSSLTNLFYAELVLPIEHQKWLKINVTTLIRSFPFTYNLTNEHARSSSAFLILYFRSHSISRRDLSEPIITYPDDPSYCQVHRLRISFDELNWSSWIIEPSSYEMNLCSGTCQTQSNMGTYFLIQNLLNQKYPHDIPAPCCKPKRLSSTMILYYDGPNLVLKRHENMRVVECACAS